jgi:allophanate hydrolase
VRQPPGARIEVEVWELPNGAFGSFVDGIAPPLSIGTVELEDGESVKGFLCEYYASSNLEDISRYGSWRSYVQSHAT